MSAAQISDENRLRGRFWSDCYPPDFDHGGEALLGDDPARWEELEQTAFLGAECALDGRIVLVVAVVRGGFVEVSGQLVRQGEPLAKDIGGAIRDAKSRVPVDRNASRLLGLDIELDQPSANFDWIASARRIELDLLSTIHRMAHAREGSGD